MRTNYRKIWQQHHNKPIPPDHEIHHIDGNFANNDPSNLLLVTIEEHLRIHEQQEDWGAVQAILMRIKNPANIGEVARKAQQERWKEGRHNFQSITTEQRKSLSSKLGTYTKNEKKGIHAINADPEKAKENARRGGLKAKEKNAGFLNVNSDKHGSKAVKGTVWWINNKGERKRGNTCPGKEWVQGMKYNKEEV